MDLDYRNHPNVIDNNDGTWTVKDALDGKDWIIRQRTGEHFIGDPADWDPNSGQPGAFAGSFNTVAFNIIGWER